MADSYRDVSQSQVYRAENAVYAMLKRPDVPVDFHGSTLTLPLERNFADLPAVQRYIDQALAHPPVVAQWNKLPAVTVVQSRSHQRAYYKWDKIYMPPPHSKWAWREAIVVHELAHHVTRYNGFSYQSHGPEFRATHVSLVEVLMGPEVALLLRANYSDIN